MEQQRRSVGSEATTGREVPEVSATAAMARQNIPGPPAWLIRKDMSDIQGRLSRSGRPLMEVRRCLE